METEPASVADAPAIPPQHPDFVGREEVVFEIYRLLSTGISWLLVTGSPGTGKTALLEHIVDCLETAGLGGLFGHREANAALEQLVRGLFAKTQHGRRIIPCHFMPGPERPRDVMLSLAKQVEDLFPDCVDAETRGADLYLANLLDRVSAVLQHRHQRLVIITDGLDQSPEALEAFARLIPRAPAGITIVCSGRPMKHDEYDWMVRSGSFARIDLDDEKWQPSNESTCVRYAEKARDEIHPGLDVDAIVAAARGSIRYVVDLIAELRHRPTAPLERTPPNFRELLEEIWDEVTALPEGHRAIARQGLEALASAPAPLGYAELADRAGWRDSTIAQTFVRLVRPYLLRHAPEPNPTYRLFHTAFERFVTETLFLERAEQSGEIALQPAVPVPSATPIVKQAAGPIEQRYFLAIGADNYLEPQLRDLGFCGNDATALAAALSALGYSAATLHDGQTDPTKTPTANNIRAALAALKGRNRNDFVWVHLSSHGMLAQNGQAYILATDSRSAAPMQTGIAVSEVVAAIKASGALRWLLTLDACHCGVVSGRDGNIPRLDPAMIHSLEVADGGGVFAASTSSQRAEDCKPDRHGLFTAALLQIIASCAAEAILTMDDLKNGVIALVNQWEFSHLAAEPQTPSFRLEGTGNLILLDRRRR